MLLPAQAAAAAAPPQVRAVGQFLGTAMSAPPMLRNAWRRRSFFDPPKRHALPGTPKIPSLPSLLDKARSLPVG
jgi:hypothetical protein